MADVQPENGTTPIAHEILEQLCRVNITAYESRFLWFLFRKTYGFHKKTDWISLAQFSEALNMDKRLVHRTIKKLKKRKMLKAESDGGQRIKYGFEKDYDFWVTSKASSREMTLQGVSQRDDASNATTSKHTTNRKSVIQRDDASRLTASKHTKKGGNGKRQSVIPGDDRCDLIPFKEQNITCRTSDEFRLSEKLFLHIRERRPSFKKPNLKSWSSHVEKMIRIDNREMSEIEQVIDWCQGDDFWQNNILSTTKLRKQFDQLALKMGSHTRDSHRPDEEFLN